MACRYGRGLVGFSVAVSVVALLMGGCGGDNDTAPVVPLPAALVSGSVDADGGELVHPDIVLTVPAGALAGATDLAIYADPQSHPFGPARGPAYRIGGLPAELGVPVTLRLRHDAALSAGDTLACFGGELREGYEFGRRVSWFALASRDSSGWCIAELDRGALPLGGKADGDVFAATDNDIDVLVHENNRYRIIFQPSVVDGNDAGAVLSAFEYLHGVTEAMGFSFGTFADIWPLDILVRAVDFSRACYITAPRGAGHFILHPDWVAAGAALAPVVAHELLHCAQTFYDPRPPEQWGTLNMERLWLDEATAAYVEAVTAGGDEYVPFGLFFTYLLAPLAGVGGHPDLSPADYGYGMASFIKYLCDDPGSGQDDQRLAQLYDHIAVHGSVTSALAAVLEPPVAAWCADMHRKLVDGRIFNPDGSAGFWHWYPITGTLNSQAGATVATRQTAPALGGCVARFRLTGEEPAASTRLSATAATVPNRFKSAGASQMEHLPLTVYGHQGSELPVLVAAGDDSLVIADFTQLHATYDDVLVLVSRPYDTGSEVDIVLRLYEDVEHAVFSQTRLDAVISNVRQQMVCEGGGCAQEQWTTYEALWLRDIDGTWNGSTFTAAWNRAFPLGDPDGERVETGALLLTVAADGAAILALAASQVVTYANGDVLTYGWSRDNADVVIPEFFDLYGYTVGYRLTGASVCSELVLAYQYDYAVLDALVTLNSYDCTVGSPTLGVFFKDAR